MKKRIDKMTDEEILEEMRQSALNGEYEREMKWMFSDKDKRPSLPESSYQEDDYYRALRKKKILESLSK